MSKDLVTHDNSDFGRGQFIVYEAEDGRVKIDVRLYDETVWLTQQLMADLFQTTKQNIGQHLKNIFSEGELLEDSVVKKFFTTAADGKKYRTNFYNLDSENTFLWDQYPPSLISQSCMKSEVRQHHYSTNEFDRP